jgi:hypothetical protein
MECAVKAEAITVILFVVIANFDRVLHRLGPGVGEKSGAKPELGSEFHELIMKVRRGWDPGFVRVFAPGTDEIAPGIPVRVDGLELGGNLYQGRVVVAQGRAANVGDEIQDHITIHVGTEWPDGRPGAVPDEPLMVG